MSCSCSFLVICFPFCQPPLKISLHFWIGIIGPYVIEYAPSEPLNGVLWNTRLVYNFMLPTHILRPLSFCVVPYFSLEVSIF